MPRSVVRQVLARSIVISLKEKRQSSVGSLDTNGPNMFISEMILIADTFTVVLTLDAFPGGGGGGLHICPRSSPNQTKPGII